VVIEFVYACAICQKNRDSMPKWDTLKPITKRLRPKHPRGRVGIDTFFVSPADDEGHTCIHVVVCHTTHLVYFYASKDHTQESMADALFNFYCTYGSFEELASDPGADLMSNLVEVLLKRFGAHHRVSLVAVHTSSGVEGTNAILAIHLRAICVDEVLRKSWGSPRILKLIEFNINDTICSETGVRRFDAMFGTFAGKYFKAPQSEPEGETPKARAYLEKLDEDMKRIQAIMKETNDKIAAKRMNGVTAATQDVYLPGELVLLQHDKDKVARTTKMEYRSRGRLWCSVSVVMT
jgi:hypothetical protein